MIYIYNDLDTYVICIVIRICILYTKLYTVHLAYIFSYCISGICRSWDCPSFCENDGGSGIDCPFLALFQTFHSEGNGPLSEETYVHFPKAKSIDLPDNLSHESNHKQIWTIICLWMSLAALSRDCLHIKSMLKLYASKSRAFHFALLWE